MRKQIFKVGDRVFDFNFKWGTVVHIEKLSVYTIEVKFDDYIDKMSFTIDGKFIYNDSLPRLSFTEYDLVNGGFSQERKIDYNDYIGKYCKFWNKDKHNTVIDRFVGYDDCRIKFFESTFDYYENFEPLTEEQIEILNLK